MAIFLTISFLNLKIVYFFSSFFAHVSVCAYTCAFMSEDFVCRCARLNTLESDCVLLEICVHVRVRGCVHCGAKRHGN